MGDNCTISGAVKYCANGVVTVETTPSGACSSCGGKVLCGSGSSRLLRIKTDTVFNPGDVVTLSVNSRTMFMLAFALYAAGVLFAMLLSVITVYIFHVSEIISAVIFLVAAILWLPAAGFILGRAARKYVSLYAQNQQK